MTLKTKVINVIGAILIRACYIIIGTLLVCAVAKPPDIKKQVADVAKFSYIYGCISAGDPPPVCSYIGSNHGKSVYNIINEQ